MVATGTLTTEQRLRSVAFFADPQHWPHWPFLPLVRRQPNGDEELGLLYDALGVSGTTGFSATVLLANLFFLPATENELLALPKETFDTPEEIADAGWRVD